MNSRQMNTGNITEADKNAKKLFFRGCFMVLIATAFGFVFQAFIIAATVFALGKTFFWPNVPGEMSEQFPKGEGPAFNFTGAVCKMGLGRYWSSISWLHSG